MNVCAPNQEGTRELIEDFLEDARDTLDDIDELLLDLDTNDVRADIFTGLYNRVHALVSILRLGGFVTAAEFGQELALILNAMRQGTMPATERVRDIVLFAVQHLQFDIDKIRHDQPLEILRLREMSQAMRSVAEAGGSDAAASIALKCLARGISTEVVPEMVPQVSADSIAQRSSVEVPSDVRRLTDLGVFHDLMIRMERVYPDMIGRGQRILKIAAAMNDSADHPVDPLQLQAAVYLHDLGMMFLRNDPWRRSEQFSDDDRKALHEHPMIGAKLLWRVGSWEDAVRIVLQHHERIDGNGYPEGITQESICPGAQILAIADAAYSMTRIQLHREHARPVIKAVAEINNCADTQFAREWVEIFNRVVHQSRGRLILDG